MSDYTNGYKNGLKKAWECARKIFLSVEDGGYSVDTLINIFGLSNNTFYFAQILSLPIEEVQKKILAWEESHHE